ncbi:MAG: Gfo/Idh/MocA family oxidoreductase [Opitutaceae bacterium]
MPSSLTRRQLTPVSRRSFLAWSAVAGAGVALSPRSWSQVVGANGDIRVAVLGLNGRGRNHLSSLAALKGVRIVALCDPDTAVLERVKNTAAKNGSTPYAHAKTYTDLRALFASPDIDAVTIATPNHWHALAGIWAMQAGKDVYVEKPVSHNVWEGRQLVLAAKKFNRVVQAGTQIRSGEGLQEAVAWIRAGNLGKITASRGFCYKRRDSIGKTVGEQPLPTTVNYDIWSGPAPVVPLHRKRLHYDWHWLNVTGNGDVGNQGIHQMDVARWFLGEPGLPRHTLSIGGRLGYDDDGDTPNTQVVVHDYATAPLIFEVRGLPAKADGRSSGAEGGAEAAGAAAGSMDKYRGVSIGNIVDCEGGYLMTASYFSATAYDKAGQVVKEFRGTDRHMQNFIDVVRSRKLADLYGPIEEGHVSSALCHLGGLSHQLGRTQAPEAIADQVRGNPSLAEAYGRMTEHLAANGVDFKKTPATLGLPLAVDAKNERFTGPTAAVANPMLTREYRAPYVVPKFAT